MLCNHVWMLYNPLSWYIFHVTCNNCNGFHSHHFLGSNTFRSTFLAAARITSAMLSLDVSGNGNRGRSEPRLNEPWSSTHLYPLSPGACARQVIMCGTRLLVFFAHSSTTESLCRVQQVSWCEAWPCVRRWILSCRRDPSRHGGFHEARDQYSACSSGNFPTVPPTCPSVFPFFPGPAGESRFIPFLPQRRKDDEIFQITINESPGSWED